MMRSIYFEYYLNLYDYINIEIADSHSFDSDTNKPHFMFTYILILMLLGLSHDCDTTVML